MGTVTRGRKSERVTFIELSADQARPVLRAFPDRVSRGVGFFKRSGLVRDGTADEFEALVGRCAVFRLDIGAQVFSFSLWETRPARPGAAAIVYAYDNGIVAPR